MWTVSFPCRRRPEGTGEGSASAAGVHRAVWRQGKLHRQHQGTGYQCAARHSGTHTRGKTMHRGTFFCSRPLDFCPKAAKIVALKADWAKWVTLPLSVEIFVSIWSWIRTLWLFHLGRFDFFGSLLPCRLGHVLFKSFCCVKARWAEAMEQKQNEKEWKTQSPLLFVVSNSFEVVCIAKTWCDVHKPDLTTNWSEAGWHSILTTKLWYWRRKMLPTERTHFQLFCDLILWTKQKCIFTFMRFAILLWFIFNWDDSIAKNSWVTFMWPLGAIV